ncbi:hypothetical protein HOY82DRAFT_635891 [Tuber indicum]|nr:hypothetical protein HOY82DRAFT_635891 [Tuber indicum]
MAVRGLIQAAKGVRKEYFPGSGVPYYTYVNNEGSAILQNMQAMRREIATVRTEGDGRLKKAEARAGEAVDRARLSDDRAREAVDRAREADDRAREAEKSSQRLQPLYPVAVSIRLRHLYNFGRLIGLETDNVVKAILTGNKAAHGGDIVTDTRMMQHGDIADLFLFHTVYESKSMVAMINTRATMLADPERFGDNWDQNGQSQFKNQITNFINQSSEGDGKWQESQSPRSPATEVHNHLVDSPPRGQPAHQRKNNKYGQPEDDAERYNRMGQPTGALTSVAFLEALRTAFPRFAKKGKCAAANPDDIASQIVPASGFGAARSPLAAAAEGKKKGEAVAKSKEAEASLGNREQRLIGELDPSIAQGEGCNLSGLYELMGVIPHQGTSATSGHYSSYVRKEGDEDWWWRFYGEKVVEVPKDRIETLAGGGAEDQPLISLYRAMPLSSALVPVRG